MTPRVAQPVGGLQNRCYGSTSRLKETTYEVDQTFISTFDLSLETEAENVVRGDDANR